MDLLRKTAGVIVRYRVAFALIALFFMVVSVYGIGQLRIRAVGDPNQGDDNVYVFEKTISVEVRENRKTESNLRNLAVGIGALVVAVVIYTYLRGRKK